MITLITATPGSGKTLYAIKLIFDYLNQGRAVYTNILGLKIDGVRLFNISTPHLHDWRDLPNGAVIVYDEAHEHPAFASDDLISDKTILKKVRQDIGDSLALHRHFGFDFILISQKHDQIRSALYGFINKHIHLHRSFGLASATVYNWRHVVTNPNAKSNRNDSEHTFTFRYPKYLYKYYNSAEQHTHKAQIPKAYILIFIAILVLLFVGIKMTLQSQLFASKPDLQQKPATTQAHSNQQATGAQPLPVTASQVPVSEYTPERRRVAFVIATETTCRAYNGLSYRVSLSDAECREYASRERDMRPADPATVETRLAALNYSGSGATPNVVKSEFVR